MATQTTTLEPGTMQVKVTFTTSDESFQLPDSKRQLLVPGDIRRYGLSSILNSESMLATPQPVPFDFLVNGTFLISTLSDYLTKSGLSFESNITLQYVRSLTPPRYEASFQHDDWVSAVDVLSATSPAGRSSGDAFHTGHDRILSASYDGLLRVWDKSGNVVATSPGASLGGHTSSIKSAKFLSSSHIASAGMDRTVRVWKYTESNTAKSLGDLKPTLELYGHKASIDSVEVDGPSKRILTASADGCIGLWSTSKASAPAAPTELLPSTHATKRRKLASTVSTPQRGPLFLMPFHKAPASAAIFDPKDRTVAYSAGQDHDLHTIDLTTMRKVSTIPASNPLLCLCALPGISSASSLLAAGTSSRNISIIDPRESQSTTSVMTLRGHVNKVISLARSPQNDYSLVSGSHDGTCRIWDLRSVRPATRGEADGVAMQGGVSEAVYVIERESRHGKRRPLAGEGCKVFGVLWDQTVGLVSVGEDKMVQINRGTDVGAS